MAVDTEEMVKAQPMDGVVLVSIPNVFGGHVIVFVDHRQ